MSPVLLVAVLVTVVLATGADQPDYGFADGIYAEPGYSSEWSYLYDDGEPVEPPDSDDPEYDSYDAPNATACYDGTLSACDNLYYQSDVGSIYEWLGSTCGGREEYETYGTCD